MNKVISSAEYMLALTTGTVTDEIRESYKRSDNISDYATSVETFNLILKCILPSVDSKVLSKDSAFELIKREFIGVELTNFLGDFELYVDFVNLLLNARDSVPGHDTINNLKRFIEVADSLNKDIAVSIYYAVLVKLTLCNAIAEDIVFSRQVIEYVKNSNNITTEMPIFDIIHDAMMNT